MTELNLHDLESSVDKTLLFARANAIQAYANLESSMSILLSILLRTEIDVAAIIFYRIVNTRSRNTIIEELYKKRLGDKFSSFRKSLTKMTNELDGKRNRIIHWHQAMSVELKGDGIPSASLSLIPPNVFAQSNEQISVGDIIAFSQKCEFVSRFYVMFFSVISGQTNADAPPWHGIFQRPIEYPPPDTHPLSPNYKAPQSPPESSQE